MTHLPWLVLLVLPPLTRTLFLILYTASLCYVVCLLECGLFPTDPRAPRVVMTPSQARGIRFSEHQPFPRAAGAADYKGSCRCPCAYCGPAHAHSYHHGSLVRVTQSSPLYRRGHETSRKLGQFPRSVHRLQSTPTAP